MPCLRPQVGSSRTLAVGKPSAPALGAVDGTAEQPGRAQEFGRLHHLALAERAAPRIPAGPRPRAAARYRRQSRAAPALLLQIGRRAGALVAEMKVETDRRRRRCRSVRPGCARRNRPPRWRRARRRRHDDGAVEPARRQQAQLVALAGELEQRVLRARNSRGCSTKVKAAALRPSALAQARRRSRRGGRGARRRNCRSPPPCRAAARYRWPARRGARAIWKAWVAISSSCRRFGAAYG